MRTSKDETYCYGKKVECPKCGKSHIDAVIEPIDKSAVCTCRACQHIFTLFVKTELVHTPVIRG